MKKEFLDDVKSFIEKYAFHMDDCCFPNTGFCDCGYRERIIKIRAQWNELYSKRDIHQKRT